MTGRVAVFCNGIVPGSGVPNGALGLRARGIQSGLSCLGVDVDIVSRASTIHRQIRKWGKDYVKIPEYWRILSDDVCEKRLHLDYQTLILPNWAGLPNFKKSDSLRLIYDFFSPTIVEHSFLVDPKVLEERKKIKTSILKQSDGLIANGEGRADYGHTFLSEAGLNGLLPKPSSVRLAMDMGAQGPPVQGVFRIFVGGFDQAWTKGLDIISLSKIATEVDCEIHTIGLGHHLHFSDDTENLSEIQRVIEENRNIICHTVSSFEEYREINASCHLALDVYERNRERELSYSTRAISSLASGCPIVTMSFCEVGNLVSGTGSGWVLDSFSDENVIEVLKSISSDSNELAKRRGNTYSFWMKYCNPEKEAAQILMLL